MKENRIDIYIGEQFRSLREKAGYSLADVSSRIGIGRQAYWNYETGRRSMPYSVMLRLADMYGFDLIEMLQSMLQMMREGRLSD